MPCQRSSLTTQSPKLTLVDDSLERLPANNFAVLDEEVNIRVDSNLNVDATKVNRAIDKLKPSHDRNCGVIEQVGTLRVWSKVSEPVQREVKRWDVTGDFRDLVGAELVDGQMGVCGREVSDVFRIERVVDLAVDESLA